MSAEYGRTFGRVAEAYARVRPGYPAVAIDRVLSELALSPEATVLDLGAGTGQLTRPLRERVARVIAVEPDDEMRAHLDGETLAGTAEAIPLPDDSVAAVFSGSAFHWFEPEAALAEIRRVTIPGGGLGLLWAEWWEGEQPRIPREFREILDQLWSRLQDVRHSNDDWQHYVRPDGEAKYEETRRISGRDLVDLALTASGPAYLGDAERAAIAERAYPLMEPEYEQTVTVHVGWKSL